MEYYEIDQEFPYTLYVAEESSMPTIRIAIGRNAYFNFEGAATVFDKRQMFALSDFIRNVAENMENYDDERAPF